MRSSLIALVLLLIPMQVSAQDSNYWQFGSVDIQGQYTAVGSTLQSAVPSMWGGAFSILYGNAWSGGLRVNYAAGTPRDLPEVESNALEKWQTYGVSIELKRRWWLASTKFSPSISGFGGYGWINPGNILTTVRGVLVGIEAGAEYEITRSVLLIFGGNLSVHNTGAIETPYGVIDSAIYYGLFAGLQIR